MNSSDMAFSWATHLLVNIGKPFCLFHLTCTSNIEWVIIWGQSQQILYRNIICFCQLLDCFVVHFNQSFFFCLFSKFFVSAIFSSAFCFLTAFLLLISLSFEA